MEDFYSGKFIKKQEKGIKKITIMSGAKQEMCNKEKLERLDMTDSDFENKYEYSSDDQEDKEDNLEDK